MLTSIVNNYNEKYIKNVLFINVSLNPSNWLFNTSYLFALTSSNSENNQDLLGSTKTVRTLGTVFASHS